MKPENERKFIVGPTFVLGDHTNYLLIGDRYVPSQDGSPPLRLRKSLMVPLWWYSPSGGMYPLVRPGGHFHVPEATMLQLDRVSSAVLAVKLDDPTDPRGVRRFEHEWTAAGLTFEAQGVKLRGTFLCGDLIVSLDHYFRPELPFRVLEVEGPSSQVTAWTPPPSWGTHEVTGDKRYKNSTLIAEGAPRP